MPANPALLREIADNLNTQYATAGLLHRRDRYSMRFAPTSWLGLDTPRIIEELEHYIYQFHRQTGVRPTRIILQPEQASRIRIPSGDTLLNTLFGLEVVIETDWGRFDDLIQLDYIPTLTAQRPYNIDTLCAPAPFPDPGHHLDVPRYPTFRPGPAASYPRRDTPTDTLLDRGASPSCSPANLRGVGAWLRAQRSVDR
jgi:hypothetical protein